MVMFVDNPRNARPILRKAATKEDAEKNVRGSRRTIFISAIHNFGEDWPKHTCHAKGRPIYDFSKLISCLG